MEQKKLSERIEAELRAAHASYSVSPDSGGYINELCSLTAKTFELEFRVAGYLRFYQEYGEKNPQQKIEIVSELGIDNVSIYVDGELLEIDEPGFNKEMEELLLGVFLNQNW